ncbi:MAG TPA: hypothetical protein VN648_24000, partial [Candidatus Methylomirabilis sp.]|nr:hypothetical protein [Candidatus Methylomirabilis sp.]
MIGTDGSVVIHETPGAGLAEFTGGDPALREHLNRLVRVVNQLSGHRTLTVNVPWLLARMGAAGKGGGTIVEAEDRDVVDVICSEAIPARAIAEIVDEDAYYGRLVVCKPTQNDLPLERIVYIPEEIPLGDDNVARGKGWLSFENVPLITEDDISQWMYAGSKSGSWKAKKSDFGIRVMSLVTRGLARLKINDEGYDFSDNFDVTFTGGKRTGSYPDPVQASATAIVGKGMIAKIRILAGGNYTNPRASLEDSSEDPGSGCELQVETDEDGHITAIKVIQRGSGYFEPENLTLTITGGTGCSYAIEVNPVIDFIWKS